MRNEDDLSPWTLGNLIAACICLVLAAGLIMLASTNPFKTSSKLTKDYRTTWTEEQVRAAIKECPESEGWPVFSDYKLYCTDGTTTRELPQR